METTVTTGLNYWQVIDDRPEQTPPVENLTDYYDTPAEAEDAFAALPGAGRLLATHDDGRSDQFDWQLEKQKPAPVVGISARRLAGLLPEKWQHLSALPEPLCEALLELAVANTGCGYNAIQANLKLEKLATMSGPQIEAAFAQRATA